MQKKSKEGKEVLTVLLPLNITVKTGFNLPPAVTGLQTI